ncbi:unnamed protein product [Knipowitschia caucasica]|uniref:Ras-GEF domain-containing protein n=1 Tax=Knipowitschia caucasica TaxID=637954 RepID=A0AAV2MNN9_KNICA
MKKCKLSLKWFGSLSNLSKERPVPVHDGREAEEAWLHGVGDKLRPLCYARSAQMYTHVGTVPRGTRTKEHTQDDGSKCSLENVRDSPLLGALQTRAPVSTSPAAPLSPRCHSGGGETQLKPKSCCEEERTEKKEKEEDSSEGVYVVMEPVQLQTPALPEKEGRGRRRANRDQSDGRRESVKFSKSLCEDAGLDLSHREMDVQRPDQGSLSPQSGEERPLPSAEQNQTVSKVTLTLKMKESVESPADPTISESDCDSLSPVSLATTENSQANEAHERLTLQKASSNQDLMPSNQDLTQDISQDLNKDLQNQDLYLDLNQDCVMVKSLDKQSVNQSTNQMDQSLKEESKADSNQHLRKDTIEDPEHDLDQDSNQDSDQDSSGYTELVPQSYVERLRIEDQGSETLKAKEASFEALESTSCFSPTYETTSCFSPLSYRSALMSSENRPLEVNVLRRVKHVLSQVHPKMAALHMTRADCVVGRIVQVSPQQQRTMGVSSGVELLTLPHGQQLRLDLLERFETMALALAVQILGCTGTLEERAALVNRLIQTASELRSAVGNLFGFGAVMRALQLPQVSRLDQTWAMLRQRHTESAVLFEKTLRPFMKNLNEGRETHPLSSTSFPHVLPLLCLMERGAPGPVMTTEEAPGDLPQLWDYDLGVDALMFHLSAARTMAQLSNVYKSNASSQLHGLEDDPELGEIFSTEFQQRLLWGHRGATAPQALRYDKFNQVLTALSNRLEPPRTRTKVGLTQI